MQASTEEILSVVSSQTRLHSKLFIAAFFWKIALKLDEWLHTKDYQTFKNYVVQTKTINNSLPYPIQKQAQKAINDATYSKYFYFKTL